MKEENLNFNTYLNYYLNNKLKAITKELHTQEKYVKPNKNFHFTTGNLYYYFDNDHKNSFEKLNEVLVANLNLYKQDLIDDLDMTDDLYEVNDDGSYLLSNLNIFIFRH
jgi:hypothetical protein